MARSTASPGGAGISVPAPPSRLIAPCTVARIAYKTALRAISPAQSSGDRAHRLPGMPRDSAAITPPPRRHAIPGPPPAAAGPRGSSSAELPANHGAYEQRLTPATFQTQGATLTTPSLLPVGSL